MFCETGKSDITIFTQIPLEFRIPSRKLGGKCNSSRCQNGVKRFNEHLINGIYILLYYHLLLNILPHIEYNESFLLHGSQSHTVTALALHGRSVSHESSYQLWRWFLEVQWPLHKHTYENLSTATSPNIPECPQRDVSKNKKCYLAKVIRETEGSHLR